MSIAAMTQQTGAGLHRRPFHEASPRTTPGGSHRGTNVDADDELLVHAWRDVLAEWVPGIPCYRTLCASCGMERKHDTDEATCGGAR